ncbi:MAG TPA: acyl-CoA dehydrogenase family protein [Acidimicrobiales bacterium]|nr:acyl-CoA dehydrogenase family protein [Acidimicrobiales bacterium]
MDFDDTPEEAAFRAEAYDFLSQHASLLSADTPPPVALTEAFSEEEQRHVRESKAWQATLYDGGWAGITWPKEYGGRGGTPIQSVIFAQEQAKFDVPGSVFAQGIGMAGPALMAHGSEALKDRFLQPMLRGDDVWCQLFSEPGSGSDLASLSTRAVPSSSGDSWTVNGQKVWTSSAHFSDWGILLARTGTPESRHRGITYFLVDMKSPGIEVRPLRQITGASHFCEVFFNDVVIPDDQRVGQVDSGWAVAMTTLTSERTLISNIGGDRFSRILQLARSTGHASDPVVRQSLVDAYIGFELVKYLGWRQITALSQGRPSGPESSVAKLGLSRMLGSTGDLIMSLCGAAGMVYSDDANARYLQGQFLGQWSSRFGGGTEQVQRNIIGERLLGLPREPGRL